MKTTQQDREAIHRLMNDVVTAFNEFDIEKLLSLHSDDIILMEPDMPLIRGKQQVRALFADFEKKKINLQLAFNLEELEVSDDMAFVRGQVIKQTFQKGSLPVEERGKFISLLKKQSGGLWLRTHVIVNYDAAPAQEKNCSHIQVCMGMPDRMWKN